MENSFCGRSPARACRIRVTSHEAPFVDESTKEAENVIRTRGAAPTRDSVFLSATEAVVLLEFQPVPAQTPIYLILF